MKNVIVERVLANGIIQTDKQRHFNGKGKTILLVLLMKRTKHFERFGPEHTIHNAADFQCHIRIAYDS